MGHRSNPIVSGRSDLMSRVRQRGTTPELAVASILTSLGCRYRKNVGDLPGSPDFANKARKWAVFVHGCFWHRHAGCIRSSTPKTNKEFWLRKFARNQKRDSEAIVALNQLGFRVLVVWECETEYTRTKTRLDVLKPRAVDV